MLCARGVLVVEDDEAVGQMLVQLLEDAGHRVSLVTSGADAKAEVAREAPGLISLDLRLPDEDGLVLCSELRTLTHAPIIVVSATRDWRAPLLAFRLGADDFVAKPFDADHLLARVEVALRRGNGASGPGPGTVSAPAPGPEGAAPPGRQNDGRVSRAGALVMDYARRQVSIGAHPIHVTPTEYRILEGLIDRAGEVVPRDELATCVWGFQDAGIRRSLDVHIRRLRAKLAPAAEAPRIAVVRGFGYLLDSPGGGDVSRARES